uniref:XK-related protein n=1 Tax=Strigamia maritima TaxID=126957 RepID=T1J4R0_STRMM
MMAQEFLPLCDVLFNIISLAAYFCDIVFDLVTVYTLYETNQIIWFVVALLFIMTSLITCQIVSFKWRNPKNCTFLILTLHCLQCGVLWRYFKLFVPVDLRHVKLDVRDLCILRMIHAFCQSIPMLMIQLYLTWNRENIYQITRLNILSTILSLLNVCWALASFNKNIRNKNVHKLVLTWLGVVSQLFWRIGTVSARVVVLTVYATLYHHWTLLVIFLHWLTMFLWLISPKNVFRGEKISFVKKYLLSTIIGFIYVFCYINLQESNAWRKVVAFYTTMCLENSLLMAVWLVHRPHSTWFEVPAIVIVWGGFGFGILSMIVYYQCFHLRRISSHEVNGVGHTSANSDAEAATNKTPKLTMLKVNGVGYVPGVFNCRLNPALKRKKRNQRLLCHHPRR